MVRELESLQRIEHPNVLTVREVFIGKTHINMVLHPFCDTDLEKIIKEAQQPFKIEKIRDILKQVVDGLHCLHGVGIMHRDLKPSNLVMAKDDVIKLADFGQARVFTQIQTEGKPAISNQFSLEVGTR